MVSYTETVVEGGGIGIDATVSLGVNGLSTLTIQPLNAGDTPIE